MADEQEQRPARRRPARDVEASGPGGPPRGRTQDATAERARSSGAARAARRAAEQVCALTGKDFEGVISIERQDELWAVGVEVVETRRIPDSADILATYLVCIDDDGELVSYRRTCRYGRGQLFRGER